MRAKRLSNRVLSAIFLIGIFDGSAMTAWAESRPAVVISVERDSAASDCPDASSVLNSVNERMGMRALVTAEYAGAKDRVRLRIRRSETGYKAVIEGEGRLKGQREVTSAESNCGSLSEALTVTLSVLVGLPSEEPLPLPTAEAKPAPVLPKIPTKTELGVGALASFGLPDSQNYAFLIDASHRKAWWSLGGGLFLAPSQSVSYAPGTVQVSHTAVVATACAVGDLHARVDFRLCATPIGGIVRAEGRGYSPDRSVSRPWFALGVGMELGGNLIWGLGWRARAMGLGPLNRERFTIDQGGVACDPSRIVFLGGLSITISIP